MGSGDRRIGSERGGVRDRGAEAVRQGSGEGESIRVKGPLLPPGRRELVGGWGGGRLGGGNAENPGMGVGHVPCSGEARTHPRRGRALTRAGRAARRRRSSRAATRGRATCRRTSSRSSSSSRRSGAPPDPCYGLDHAVVLTMPWSLVRRGQRIPSRRSGAPPARGSLSLPWPCHALSMLWSGPCPGL